MMDWLRQVYIKLFEVPSRWKAWVIFAVLSLVGFFSAWWMQEQGWPG